jgi:hypothetical protein
LALRAVWPCVTCWRWRAHAGALRVSCRCRAFQAYGARCLVCLFLGRIAASGCPAEASAAPPSRLCSAKASRVEACIHALHAGSLASRSPSVMTQDARTAAACSQDDLLWRKLAEAKWGPAALELYRGRSTWRAYTKHRLCLASRECAPPPTPGSTKPRPGAVSRAVPLLLTGSLGGWQGLAAEAHPGGRLRPLAAPGGVLAVQVSHQRASIPAPRPQSCSLSHLHCLQPSREQASLATSACCVCMPAPHTLHGMPPDP